MDSDVNTELIIQKCHDDWGWYVDIDNQDNYIHNVIFIKPHIILFKDINFYKNRNRNIIKTDDYLSISEKKYAKKQCIETCNQEYYNSWFVVYNIVCNIIGNCIINYKQVKKNY